MKVNSPVSSFDCGEIAMLEEAAANKNPTRRGEEGSLYRCNVDGRDLWLKRWYRSHEVGYSINPDLGGAALSPFYARMKSEEYEIIHALFPDVTVDMIGGYDKRCTEKEGERGIELFGIFDGRPTTVSKNVEGDPDLIAKYDAIVVPAQKLTVDFRDKGLKDGTGNPDPSAPFFVNWRRDVNGMVHDLLGPELAFPWMQIRDKGDYLRQVAETARKLRMRNPKNIIPEMVEAGIYPIHPEVNFVPGTSRTHERPPHGTFLELKIFNMDLLCEKIKKLYAQDPENHQKIKEKIRNLETLRKLHQLFHKIVFETQYPPDRDEIKYDGDFTTTLGDCLYRLFMLYNSKKIDGKKFNDECAHLPQKVMALFLRSDGLGALVDGIKRFCL